MMSLINVGLRWIIKGTSMGLVTQKHSLIALRKVIFVTPPTTQNSTHRVDTLNEDTKIPLIYKNVHI